MKHPRQITFEFVDLIPAEREEGKLYISIKYRTAVHNCFCGCGMKVVTPIRPTGWQLTYDGDSVSLNPSVGNWSFKCRSHYVIRGNRALPAGPMTHDQIEAGRDRDQAVRAAYFGQVPAAAPVKKRGLWERLFGFGR
jgi:hypothetical protein